MNPYIPNTDLNKKEMMRKIGIQKVSELFSDIPQEIQLQHHLKIPNPHPELTIDKKLKNIASKNQSTEELVCFLGAGAYDHYIPSIVSHLSSRSEFYTAYTPYQPEISQGTLQGIFEYQSLIAELTGMDISNASLYDGGTALAEAALIACENTKRKKIFVSKGVHPESRKILSTYLQFHSIELEEIPLEDGATSIDYLKKVSDSNTACVIAQNPNFFGIIEEMGEMSEVAHAHKGMFVASINPISLGVLTTPVEYGADIAVGEGQCLGNPLYFGGPYLGFLTTTKKLMRKIPGRICGMTEDIDGKRAFVLTLQAREQHIRREKAISNICSNQGLNALNAAIYLSTLGKEGIREVASQCAKKANYAMKELTQGGKFARTFQKPFFMEFCLNLGDTDFLKLNQHLLKNRLLGGFHVSKSYPEYPNAFLICVTEKRTKEEIHKLKNCMEAFL
jgi:glycine dehydrogenase subunit 1